MKKWVINVTTSKGSVEVVCALLHLVCVVPVVIVLFLMCSCVVVSAVVEEEKEEEEEEEETRYQYSRIRRHLLA